MAVSSMQPAERGEFSGVGRALFNTGFVMCLGTMFAYSAWSDLFVKRGDSPGPFPDWTIVDLDFVYSLGALGSYSVPLGGFIYDVFGPSPTYLAGLLLTVLGNLGMILSTLLPLTGSNTRYVVGACYFLQEQGSSELVLAIYMDTLIHSPPAQVKLAMGSVTMGYSLSSVIATAIMRKADFGILVFLPALLTASTVFSLIRLCLLGDVTAREGPPPHSVGVPSVRALSLKAQMRPALRVLLVGCFCNVAILSALLGFLKPMGNAFQVDGMTLTQAFLLVNCGARLATGWLCNTYPHVSSKLTYSVALVAGCAGLLLMLLSTVVESFAPALLVAGCVLAALSFGASACTRPLFVREHFPAKVYGCVYGAGELFIALGGFCLIGIFGPRSNTDKSFFARPLLAAVYSSVMSLLIVFPDLGLVQRWPVAPQ